jgi:hypothetical protein
VDTIYDLLDLVRGIEVYLNTIPGASLVAMRKGFRSVGVGDAGVLGYTAPRANSGSFFLTANTETTYGSMFLDLKANGPTVIENPPNSLCVLDDFWFRYVADLGLAGPDKGAGGKYLILPPGYEGEVPAGYFTYRSPTFTNWLVVRALGGVEDIVKTRVYPLDQAADPPKMAYLNMADQSQNTVHANDFSFYEEINTLIQEEPAMPACSTRAPNSTISPPSSPPPWLPPAWALVPLTPTPPWTPTATGWTAARATGSPSRRTSRPRTSGRSTSTTPRPARCSRRTTPIPQS